MDPIQPVTPDAPAIAPVQRGPQRPERISRERDRPPRERDGPTGEREGERRRRREPQPSPPVEDGGDGGDGRTHIDVRV